MKVEHVLKDHLADPDQAAKYLTACYEEGSEVFLQPLRDVVEAQGGMTRAARLVGSGARVVHHFIHLVGVNRKLRLAAVAHRLGDARVDAVLGAEEGDQVGEEAVPTAAETVKSLKASRPT